MCGQTQSCQSNSANSCSRIILVQLGFLIWVALDNIPTKKKGSVSKISRIPRRDISISLSVEKHTSVDRQESEIEMGYSNYYLLSSSNMINGQTILSGTKAAKKRGRGEGVESSLAKRIRQPWR